jgi:hypothetical protein
MKSWKTTLAGAVALAVALVAQFWPEYSELLGRVTAVLVGLGLLAARDNGVSSEAAGAK